MLIDGKLQEMALVVDTTLVTRQHSPQVFIERFISFSILLRRRKRVILCNEMD
jgi:transcription-repair coupling factor (superfamily II helicase)